MTNLTFYNDAVKLNLRGHIAWVKKGITNQRELFNALHNELQFPYYDGRNWNALNDLLGDLNWISDKNVSIVHHELPDLTVTETRIYLEILRDSITSWQEDKKHRNEKTPWAEHVLSVYFPCEDQAKIEAVLLGNI